MALDDKLKQPMEEEDTRERLTDDEEDDLRIMVNLAKNLIDEGGYEVIESAENSSDPGQVIGQFLMQMGSQIAEELPEEAKPSPRIFLGPGGWVEQVSDYLQEEYEVPTEVMDRAEMYIGAGAQAIAQGQQQPGGPAGAAPAAPAMPQPGGMV